MGSIKTIYKDGWEEEKIQKGWVTLFLFQLIILSYQPLKGRSAFHSY